MKLRKITTQKDFDAIKSFFFDIFWEVPEYDLHHFKDAIEGRHDFQRLEYYLACEGDQIVGVTGIYADRPDECWLGWFGVRPAYRQKGYATQMLVAQLKIMRDYGYKVCRLYTDEELNKDAFALYLKNGFIKDSDWTTAHIVTMVQSLDGVTKATPWTGKPLALP